MTGTTEQPIRISKIAGRFLLFDAGDVALLRRHHNINGLLVGTTPQQPTQNMFLGLPVEIRPEEVSALVALGVAFVVDDLAAHTSVFRDVSAIDESPATAQYVDSLRRRRAAARKALIEQKAHKSAVAAAKFNVDRSSAKEQAAKPALVVRRSEGDVEDLTRDGSHDMGSDVAITPTGSDELISAETYEQHRSSIAQAGKGALVSKLQGGRYFMTPGLRFGAQYSVYPGDPLRFHAHFMANEYGWHESINMLEIVEGGRLATAVKKAFVIGGRSKAPTEEGLDGLKTFSIEWAAM